MKGSYTTLFRSTTDNSTPRGSQPNETQDDAPSYRLVPGGEEHESSWKVEAGQLFMLHYSQDTARGRLLQG